MKLTRAEMPGEKRFIQSMRKLAARLAELQDRAHSLGVFPGDRELLECPHCGLMEDGSLVAMPKVGLQVHEKPAWTC